MYLNFSLSMHLFHGEVIPEVLHNFEIKNMKEKTILLKSSAYRNYRQNLAPREILVDGQMKYPVPGSYSSKAR